MLAGHFTTALIAKQKFPKGTLLYFLIISQLQDFLWFLFHYLGLEPTNPTDAFDATLSNMVVDMLYSHDLLPQLFWLAVVFLAVSLVLNSSATANHRAALPPSTSINGSFLTLRLSVNAVKFKNGLVDALVGRGNKIKSASEA